MRPMRLPSSSSSHDNQRFGLDQAAAQSFFLAAEVALVNFDPSGQQIAPRPHHRTAQLVQPGPGRLILLQAQHTLQSESAGAVLLGRHPPHRLKP
jgi:hypothetical protein